jgi:hypothetical protein
MNMLESRAARRTALAQRTQTMSPSAYAKPPHVLSRREISRLMLRRLRQAPLSRAAWAAILCSLVLAVAFDRGYWAEVSQWREDQACNVWLGYSQGPFALPVGLISSVETPNPNGMPLLAVALTKLPNLWAISTALGLLQGVLVVWVCWLIAGASPLFFVLALPALTAVVLRATSVEFWNQWILASLNLLFFGLWISYLRRRTAWSVAWFIWPILYAPALYLAGLVNSVVYVVFVVSALWMWPPKLSWKRCIGPGAFVLASVALAAFITWIPYWHVMAGKPLPGRRLSLDVAADRVLASMESALDFAHWNLKHWTAHAADGFLQSESPILSVPAKRLLKWSTRLMFAQALLFTITVVVLVVTRVRKSRRHAESFLAGRQFQGRAIVAGLGFVLLSALVSPLLGGPSWTKGERADQQIQFLPLLLFAWFALPLVVNLPARTGRVFRVLSCVLAFGFSAVSLGAGFEIVSAHLDYRGRTLTDADVPLKHQRQAIEFIAHDWMSHSASPRIPVSYRHGQEWVIDFGKKLLPWYPAPMTVGRAFDFELSRVYGLTNTQEGIQVRTSNSARYIVTYAFRDPPRVRGMSVSHHTFGRIRVTVLQK